MKGCPIGEVGFDTTNRRRRWWEISNVNVAKYRCLKCRQSQFEPSEAYWTCAACGHRYPCVSGIPSLFLESRLGAQDRSLRQTMYNNFFGIYYRRVMPFLTLPVRPLRQSWPDWILYFALSMFLIGLASQLVQLLIQWQPDTWTIVDLAIAFVGICVAAFLLKQRYLLCLLIVAVPARLSLWLADFKPQEEFRETHARLIGELMAKNRRLKILDVCTGTCASLYKHGWMKLDAEFTGVDLSETMLLQGRDFMASKRMPVELVLADAADLPFQSETFDAVLSYGAINGVSDAAAALGEMARVTKSGGLVFFLDEQLYKAASPIERWYFQNVLSKHNVIHECPANLIPSDLQGVEVHQVYQFYYICTAYKA